MYGSDEENMELAKRAKRSKPAKQINLEWWNSLSETEQEKYVKEHPRTPYRRYLKQSKRKAKKTAPGQAPSGGGVDKQQKADDLKEYSPENIKIDIPSYDEEPKTKFDETKDLKDLNYNEQVNVEIEKDVKAEQRQKEAEEIERYSKELDAEIQNELKGFKKLSDSLSKFNEDQRAFFRKGQQKPESEYRRSVAQAIRDKARGIKHALKHEVKEWKEGAAGIRTWLKGGKIDHHQKAALKNMALHSALVVVPAAATGGLAAGLGALPMLAFGFLEHTLLLATGRSAIWANVDENLRDPDSYSDDELLEIFIEKFADGIQSAPTSNRDWIAAFMKSNMIDKKRKEQVEASVKDQVTRLLFKDVPVGMKFRSLKDTTAPNRYMQYEKISATKAKLIAKVGYGVSASVYEEIQFFGINMPVLLEQD